MTEPPQDDARRPEPGARPPQYGPAAQEYGQPTQQYGEPPYLPPPGAPQDVHDPYGQYAPGRYGPDQYVSPYGPGSAPPAQKSRAGLIAGGTLVLVLLIAAGVVAALTLGPRILHREAAERDVAEQFEELNGVAVDLECPDDMVLESGAEYTCTGVTDEGEEVELVIAVTDPPGDAGYTWSER